MALHIYLNGQNLEPWQKLASMKGRGILIHCWLMAHQNAVSNFDSGHKASFKRSSCDWYYLAK